MRFLTIDKKKKIKNKFFNEKDNLVNQYSKLIEAN